MDLDKKCIDATDIWKSFGRPCSGDINAYRIRRKLKYKNVIKEASANDDNFFNETL